MFLPRTVARFTCVMCLIAGGGGGVSGSKETCPNTGQSKLQERYFNAGVVKQLDTKT